jgi:chromosome segregation ATPase
MTRSHKALIVIVVATLGLWGCAQSKSKPTANSEERIKSLEARCDQQESENQKVIAARDKAQKLLAEADRERQRLLQEVETLQAITRERDDLKVLVASRTAERDAIQTHFEELRKGIRSLLGRVESSLPHRLDLPGSAATQAPRG